MDLISLAVGAAMCALVAVRALIGRI